jgi:hypothetical protein
MGLETKAINSITEKFDQAGIQTPTIWWEYGTLWADRVSGLEVDLIVEGLEDVINPNFSVLVNKLKATKTEPWDQWAFDIVGGEC